MGKAIKLDSRMKIETSNNDGSPDQTRKSGFQRIAIHLAGTFIGQAVLMQFDKMLWSLEKTATWISNKTGGRKGKAPVSLVRPLPWIVFLPTLILLRYARVVLSLAAICLGFDEIEASTMVSFLHNSRRYLRKIKQEAVSRNSSPNKKQSIYPETLGNALMNKLTSVCTWSLHSDARIPNNKSSLDVITDEPFENGSQSSDDSYTDSEDPDYKNLLARDFPESESEDEDFICDQSHSTEVSIDNDSFNDENSFFEDGEVDDRQHDLEKFYGEKIRSRNSVVKPTTNGDKNHEPINEPTTSTIDSATSEHEQPPIETITPTNNHKKDNGKKSPRENKTHKSKGKHSKKN